MNDEQELQEPRTYDLAKDNKCPACDHALEQCTSYVPPTPGIMSICFYCGACLRLDDTMHSVLVTQEEVDQQTDSIKQFLIGARQVVRIRNTTPKAG